MFTARETELACEARMREYEQVIVPASMWAARVQQELGTEHQPVWRAVVAWLGEQLVMVGEHLRAGGAVTPKPSV